MATMLRPFLLGGLCWLCLAPAASAQDALQLLLRDPAPVADATVELIAVPEQHLPAISELGMAQPGLAESGIAGAPRSLSTRSDARGAVRIAVPADRRAIVASGHVHTTAGLGGLVADLRPGRAQRIDLLPMGEVTTATGSETFTLHARALLPSGATALLAPQTGTKVRLPAGSYELWARSDDGWLWRRLTVVSGSRTQLDFTAPARAFPIPAGTELRPAGWPWLDLVGGGDRITLRGAARSAALVTRVGDRWLGPRVPDLLGDPALPPWPGPTFGRRVEVPDGTRLITLLRQRSGAWQLLESDTVRDQTTALALPAGGDVWLLQLAPGRAPVAGPWSGDLPPRLPQPAGVPLVVTAREPGGTPVSGLRVDYTPLDMDPAEVVADSDERGIARLGPVHAPGRLRISDPRFRNRQIELAAVPQDGITVVVERGSDLAGRATWPDGTPAQGVVVTLRDADGRLRPSVRAVASGDAGEFTFGGLPDDRPLVLFASAQREGRTWSGKLDRQLAGGEPITLVLRDEDPQLLPAGGR
jgi:hypothetical protein